jgi:hypothetical protein
MLGLTPEVESALATFSRPETLPALRELRRLIGGDGWNSEADERVGMRFSSGGRKTPTGDSQPTGQLPELFSSGSTSACLG